MADINIAPNARPAIKVNLVGKPLMVKPPKSAIAIEMARSAKEIEALQASENVEDSLKILDVLFDWLSMVLDKKDVTAIKARLKDPNDGLDINHLTTLLSAVTTYAVKANPTS